MGPMGHRVAGDVWTHEQDGRATLGMRGLRDDPAIPDLARGYAGLLHERWAAFPDAPATEVVVDGVETFRFGGDRPELTLRTSGYEFVRTVVGRRSRAQHAAADWTGPDPERVFVILSRLDLPDDDVED